MTAEELLDKSTRAKRAMNNFREGYNCSQAVVLAFSDLFNMDESMLLKLSCSFGGGMGRLREVCGTVSGMFMVAGLLYGYDEPKDFNAKSEQYKKVQELAKRFTDINGSIVCRDLLGLTEKKSEPISEKRTEEYYKKRPCEKLVGIATAIMEEYINETTAGLS